MNLTEQVIKRYGFIDLKFTIRITLCENVPQPNMVAAAGEFVMKFSCGVKDIIIFAANFMRMNSSLGDRTVIGPC